MDTLILTECLSFYRCSCISCYCKYGGQLRKGTRVLEEEDEDEDKDEEEEGEGGEESPRGNSVLFHSVIVYTHA